MISDSLLGNFSFSIEVYNGYIYYILVLIYCQNYFVLQQTSVLLSSTETIADERKNRELSSSVT